MTVPFDDTDPRTVEALMGVKQERQRQDRKWGEQRHGMTIWLTVLQEEVGEAAQDILKLRSLPATATNGRLVKMDHLREEVTQIAAVAVAWLEHINEALANDDGMASEVWG